MCDLKDLISDCNKAAGAAGKLASVNEKLEKSFRDLVSPIRSVASEFEKLTREVGDLERRLKAVSNLIDPLRRDMSKLNGELQDGVGRFQNLTKEVTSYSDAVREAEKRVGSLNAKQAASGKSTTPPGGGGGPPGKDDKMPEKIGKLGGALTNSFLGAATGQTQSLIEGLSGVVDVFATASAEGINFKTILSGLGGQFAPLLTQLGPIGTTLGAAVAPFALPLAGVAAAAAVAVGAVAITAQQIGKTVGENLDHLNLTEEQMERVKNKGVTMGDVLMGIWKGVADVLVATFGPALGAIGDFFGDLYQGAIDGLMAFVKASFQAVGGFVGGFRGAMSALPAVIGDLFYSAINMTAEGFETMANNAIGVVNKLIHMANDVAAKLGIPIRLPEMDTVSISRVENRFAGAAANMGKAIAKGASEGATAGGKAFDDMSKKFIDNVREARDERVIKEAGKAEKVAASNSIQNITNNNTTSNQSARNTSTRNSSVYAADRHAEIASRDFSNVRDVKTVGVEEPVAALEAIKAIKPDKLDVMPKVDEESIRLSKLIDHFETLNKLATELGPNLEKAFGAPGKAVSGVIAAASTLGKKLADISLAQRGSTDEKDAVKFARDRVNATVSGFAEMSSAAQGFFDKNSSGYAALQSVEKAYRTWQMAQQIQAMALEAVATARAIASSIAKGSASTAAGAAKMFEVLGPFAFPAVAAMVTLLASFGLSGGGGSVPGANDMKTRQDAQGTGSVLGDSKAKSDSLEKALTFAEAYQNKDLEYGNAMVRSLKSIDDQIGAVAAALAKSFAAGGMLSTEGLNLGKTGTSASLSNFGFGKTTTRTLQDQGIQFDAASLSDIIAGGLSGSTYQQILETTKKKALFMPVGSKSKVITETGALDGDFVDQITKLIASLGKGVADAGKAIKATGVEEVLASFKVDLGKLSFKDMTGAQIEEALNAIFGKLGDDMAKAAVPAIAEFQKVGEGAFETLVRVARQYEVIDTTLKSVGMQFGEVGLASLAARENLVELVGGLDNLTDQTAFFAEHFLSEGERLKPVQDSVAAELKRLELPADLSREGFKNLVLAQNLSTEKGAELYAALMALAPAFDKVATAAENSTSAIAETAAKMVSDAQAGVDTARSNLQAAYDAEKTRLQKIVDDAGAAESALRSAYESQASTIQSTIDRLKSFSQATKDFGRSLLTGDQSGASTSQRYDATRAEFERIRGLALSGDETAQGQFQSAAQDFLKAASENASTAIGYLADLGVVKSATDQLGQYADSQTSVAEQQLAQLKSQVGALIDLGGDVKSVESAINDLLTARQAASTAEDQLKALDAQVAGLIELNASTLSVRDAVNALNAALLALANAQTAQKSGAGWTSSYGGVAVPTNPGYANPYGDNGAVLGQADAVGKNNAGQVTFFGYTAAELAWTSSPLELGGMKTDAALALVELKKMYGPNVLPGFARGGAFMIGGFAGVDQNLLSINGAPAARVGQGEIVTITPPGRAANDNSWGEVLAELRSLRVEVAQLRQDGRTIGVATVKAVNQPQWAQDWDVEGMPEERKA